MGTLWVVPLLKMQSGDTTAMKNRIQFAQTTGFQARTWATGVTELLKKNEPGTHNFNLFARFLSFSVLGDGAFCQKSYCGLLHSWAVEESVA